MQRRRMSGPFCPLGFLVGLGTINKDGVEFVIDAHNYGETVK
jgi:hypothetical protein